MHTLFLHLPSAGYVHVLMRTIDGGYAPIYAIHAHIKQIDSLALNNNASILATVCCSEGEVKLWDVIQGAS